MCFVSWRSWYLAALKKYGLANAKLVVISWQLAENHAEGFGNKHTNIYTECISRAQREIKETMHHLKMAQSKGYISKQEMDLYIKTYEECLLMLYGLEHSLQNKKR